MEKILILPAGYDEVPVCEIPWRIAEAGSNTNWIANDHLLSINKRDIPYDMTPEELVQTVPVSELTKYDWEELNEVCKKAKLPLVQKGMPVSEYRLCERAFEESVDDWILIPYTQHTQDYHALKSVEDAHKGALKMAVSKGEVVVHDKFTHLPLSEPTSPEQFRAAYMTVGELSRYVAQFNMEVLVGKKGIVQKPILHISSMVNDMPPCITPGMVTITKLAINAAWEIEHETGQKASAKSVIKRLQEWVTSKKHAELIEIIPHGIEWMTTTLIEKSYDINACAATLKSWNQNRAQAEAKDSDQKLSTLEKTPK